MRRSLALLLFVSLLLLAAPARAGEDASPAPASEPTWVRWADFAHGPAFEVNVLWPIFPGGITELKVLVPVVRPEREAMRGELVLGVYSDFANRVVRDSSYGKVSLLEAMVGYRQFFVYGLHVEAVVASGWREEVDNPRDGTTLESFHVRVWCAAGWQYDFSRNVYANVRGLVAPGFRVGDKYASSERLLTGGADINLAYRFQ